MYIPLSLLGNGSVETLPRQCCKRNFPTVIQPGDEIKGSWWQLLKSVIILFRGSQLELLERSIHDSTVTRFTIPEAIIGPIGVPSRRSGAAKECLAVPKVRYVICTSQSTSRRCTGGGGGGVLCAGQFEIGPSGLTVITIARFCSRFISHYVM
jgi:hypothetical protein